ncbi:protein TolA, partial [Comamonas sp. JNW]
MLVVVALLWTVRNPRDSDQPSVEAELWAPTNEQVAPAPLTPPPP